jgi:SAM-dependent methyltransferase
MTNPIFQPTDFNSMVGLVVGHCNGVKGLERWELETPLFAEAISKHITPDIKTVLDYGCGVGRLARAVLEKNPDIELFGVDDSPKQLNAALAYVNSENFETLLPCEFDKPVDLIYCVYVLQHIPAIELREALQRMHYFLKPGGRLIVCSSDCRMSVRFDRPQFFDDRFLGVNIRKEIGRWFEPQGQLFSDEEMEAHPILRTMILGKSDPVAVPEAEPAKKPSKTKSKKAAKEAIPVPEPVKAEEKVVQGITHPAFVYKRRDIEGPIFNAPYTQVV